MLVIWGEVSDQVIVGDATRAVINGAFSELLNLFQRHFQVTVAEGISMRWNVVPLIGSFEVLVDGLVFDLARRLTIEVDFLNDFLLVMVFH